MRLYVDVIWRAILMIQAERESGGSGGSSSDNNEQIEEEEVQGEEEEQEQEQEQEKELVQEQDQEKEQEQEQEQGKRFEKHEEKEARRGRPYKVQGGQGKERKGVVANSFKELVDKGRGKLVFTEQLLCFLWKQKLLFFEVSCFP